MPKPPMSDDVLIHPYTFDAFGEVITDRNNQFVFDDPIPSKARVQYISETNFESNSSKNESIIEASVPPETDVRDGYLFEWIDRFGKVIKEPIEGVTEVLNFTGNKVYFRTIFINKSPTRV